MNKIKVNIGSKVSVYFQHDESTKNGIIHGIPMSELTDLRITINNQKYRFQYTSKYHHYERLQYGEVCDGFLIKKNNIENVRIKLITTHP